MTQPIELAAEQALRGPRDTPPDGAITAMHHDLGAVGATLSQLYNFTGELAADTDFTRLLDTALEAHRHGIPPASYQAAADVLHAAIRRTQPPQVMP